MTLAGFENACVTIQRRKQNGKPKAIEQTKRFKSSIFQQCSHWVSDKVMFRSIFDK